MKMEEICLPGSRILIGEHRENFRAYIPPDVRVIIVTERKIAALYADFLKGLELLQIEGGEAHKTWITVERLVGELLELGADRTTFIIGFGGGIVCDVTGFVASIFMRGCRFGFIPTTLLAQVDASIGGKNGVNYRGYKNIMGVFSQPEFVLCDFSVLQTLSEREYVAGLAEVVKAAIIADPLLFEYLEREQERILHREEACLVRIVGDAVRVKSRIVAEDERESGVRRLLNLGHTFAHAIEKNQRILHGEAVSVGLCMAARLAVRWGVLEESDCRRIESLLSRFLLPLEVDLPLSVLVEAMYKDKKRSGAYLHLILPCKVGKCEDREVSFAELC